MIIYFSKLFWDGFALPLILEWLVVIFRLKAFAARFFSLIIFRNRIFFTVLHKILPVFYNIFLTNRIKTIRLWRVFTNVIHWTTYLFFHKLHLCSNKYSFSCNLADWMPSKDLRFNIYRKNFSVYFLMSKIKFSAKRKHLTYNAA